MHHLTRILAVMLVTLPVSVWAETLPCKPCAGLVVENLDETAALYAAQPALGDARLWLGRRVVIAEHPDVAQLAALGHCGAVPLYQLVLGTPTPVAEHGQQLKDELDIVVSIAAAAAPGSYFQILWEPPEATLAGHPAAEYAFVLKRVSVAIGGVNSEAQIITAPLPHDSTYLHDLYSQEISAYIDDVAIPPASDEALTSTLNTLLELDPGRPVVVDALELPEEPALALAQAAQLASLGVSLTLFTTPEPGPADVAWLKVLAREFAGDLAFDPYSTPTGPAHAWAFVRGDDLGLRLVIEDGEHVQFSGRDLSNPVLVTNDGERTLFGRGTAQGLSLTIDPPPPVGVLRLDRISYADLGGFGGEMAVEDQWQMPVEEILRRLQAFEDAQKRKLKHYQAVNTMHLRYRVAQALQPIEASFEGPFFFEQGKGFDWAWQTLYINGVEWHGKLPEIPLIQPDKAAALPLEIHFTKEYAYRLRKTDVVDGRDCWVVDFEPLEATAGRNLYQGTVWIDRELYARVKTKALQLKLEGEVLSNEETVYFEPLDANGAPAAFAASSFFLPTRVVGRELQSLFNASVQVEKETVLTDIRINREGFADQRRLVEAQDVTMVRDTPEGLRYLEQGKDGTRTVKTDDDSTYLAGLVGTYYDDSRDYPLPLGGINYTSLNVKESGRQLNVFFAGIMGNANISQPHLFGSDWDAGGRLFALLIPFDQVLYRNGERVYDEEVEARRNSLSLYLGHPLGEFAKLDFTYGLAHQSFGTTDDTAEGFVLPQDGLTHSFGTELTYTRSGYRLHLAGSLAKRSSWEFWGLPGNTEFNQDQDSPLLWSVTAEKSWYLHKFMRFGAVLEHLDGDNLDRFSKYDFSFFSGSRVSGYQGGLVTASEADLVHLTYGFNLGDVLRFELKGDAAWATDEMTGLDRDLLAGVSLNGSLIGPWQTIVNFDVGYPVQGPGEGFVVSLVVLKLFD